MQNKASASKRKKPQPSAILPDAVYSYSNFPVPIGNVTIWTEIRAGRLLVTKIGARTLFRGSDILRWLEQRTIADVR